MILVLYSGFPNCREKVSAELRCSRSGGYLCVSKYDVGIRFSIAILSRQVFGVSDPDNEDAKCPSV